MNILNPFLKSPLTDLTDFLVCNQWGNSQCAAMEMKALDCLEAYGLDRGIQKCEVLLRDFEECVYKRKQNNRIIAMRKERHRQWFAGERKKEDLYVKDPPASDSY